MLAKNVMSIWKFIHVQLNSYENKSLAQLRTSKQTGETTISIVNF